MTGEMQGPERLTLRQREVLLGIASGRPRKQVAADLGISVQTLGVHCREIYRRLQVHSVVELVRRAQQLGLTER